MYVFMYVRNICDVSVCVCGWDESAISSMKLL